MHSRQQGKKARRQQSNKAKQGKARQSKARKSSRQWHRQEGAQESIGVTKQKVPKRRLNFSAGAPANF